MTIQEMSPIMAMLEGAYPHSYHQLGSQEKANMVKMWATMLADADPRLVAAAVQSFISTDPSQFPPSIGAIRNRMVDLCTKGELPVEMLWPSVSRAIQAGTPRCFNELPPLVQEALGGYGGMKSIGKMPREDLEKKGKDEFIQAYKVVLKRHRDEILTPPNVKALVSQVCASLPQVGE